MPFLTARVDPYTKNRFREIAKARGEKESELLRAIVLIATGAVDQVSAPARPGQEADDADLDRITVWMPAFMVKATKRRAKEKGMAASRYVAALIQSNLTRDPVLTDTELVDLRASNRELAAIGRNINQIARTLNEAFHKTEQVRLEKLAELARAIEHNRASIRALVRASRNAWEVENESD